MFGVLTCKMLFLKISPFYTFPYFTDRRAGESRENSASPPRQQKVLFVNICHRHWLFSARRFPREFPSGHSGTSSITVPLPLGCPALRGPRNARGVLGCALSFRPREFPHPLKKSHQNAIFLAFLQKLLYLCTRN